MKKILMIIGGIVVGLIILGGIIFFTIYVKSDKIICSSSNGNITILYNEDELSGFTTSGNLTFDFDTQNAYAKTIGTDSYIEEFKTWFSENTDGTCK